MAWGITGSGDYIREIVQTMHEVSKEYKDIEFYIFLSKAANKVIEWYGLKNNLKTISDKIFLEIDANTTEPYYYLPGALQLGKFEFFIICPTTSNTVAKIVTGIADTLITNSIAQAAKANIPIYVMPVDQHEGKQVTTLPSGQRITLEMRDIDIKNTKALSGMKNIKIFFDPSDIKRIVQNHINN